MIKENVDRWLFASVSKFMYDRRQNITLYMEGQARTVTEEDYVQMRYNGPLWNQYNPVDYLLRVEINLLVCALMDEDTHKIYKMCGIFENALEESIPTYKYGDTPGVDDQSFLGCLLRQRSGGNQEIIVTHFGQVSPDVRVMQSTIEAHYLIDLRING